MFVFYGKPDEVIREVMKTHDFYWSPTRSAWVRKLNNAGIRGIQQGMASLASV